MLSLAEYFFLHDEGCLFEKELVLFEWKKKLKLKLLEEAKKKSSVKSF